MNDKEILREQYQRAIDARDKLNDNHHKWMTYYYIANGAVLVALTTIDRNNGAVFALSFLGIVTAILWHLSCKGYYYWSLSWIEIVKLLEKKLIENDAEYGVYTFFSKSVHTDNKKNTLHPIKPANISTPKLTLLFSFIAICAWLGLFIYQVFLEQKLNLLAMIIISITAIIAVILSIFFLQKNVVSKNDDKHTLV